MSRIVEGLNKLAIPTKRGRPVIPLHSELPIAEQPLGECT